MICGYRISTPLLTIEPKQKKIVLEDENIVKRIDENVWKEKNLNYHGWWMIKTAIINLSDRKKLIIIVNEC